MKKIVGRILLCLFSTLAVLFAFVLGVCFIVFNGPSKEAGRLLCRSCHETSAMGFLPGWFLTEAEEDAIMNPIPTVDLFVEYGYYNMPANEASANGTVSLDESSFTDELEFINIKGTTYKGVMMIVHDPKRVMFAAVDKFGGSGYLMNEFISKYNAVAATNAGGFDDPGGRGAGGTPDGLIIRNGQLAYGEPEKKYVDVIGFDPDGILHVGDMKAQEALDLGIVNAVSFSSGPVLIQDGVRCEVEESGLNPRTCIGQRADGAVLIATLEGRHPDSLGATYDDLIDLMEDYGAVNAANLDGGSSTVMYYQGERMIRSCSVLGERRICSALLIMESAQ